MASAVHDDSETVAVALGVAGNAQATQLPAVADSIDLALDAPATIDAALARWEMRANGLRGELVAFLLAQIPIPRSLFSANDGWTSAKGLRLGPPSGQVES